MLEWRSSWVAVLEGKKHFMSFIELPHTLFSVHIFFLFPAGHRMCPVNLLFSPGSSICNNKKRRKETFGNRRRVLLPPLPEKQPSSNGETFDLLLPSPLHTLCPTEQFYQCTEQTHFRLFAFLCLESTHIGFLPLLPPPTTHVSP